MYLYWTFHSALSPNNLLQPGAITNPDRNFPSATEKLLSSFPAWTCQAEIEAVTSSLHMGVSSQSMREKKVGASLLAAPFYKPSHRFHFSREQRGSASQPGHHRITNRLWSFAHLQKIHSWTLLEEDREHTSDQEKTLLQVPAWYLCQASERLSPDLLIKLFPLQFLFSYRHSLPQLQVIPVKAQPQMVKITKFIINSLWIVFPCGLCALPHGD